MAKHCGTHVDMMSWPPAQFEFETDSIRLMHLKRTLVVFLRGGRFRLPARCQTSRKTGRIDPTGCA